MEGVRPTGHLQVKGGPGQRRYYALWRDGEGRHQKMIGPAHVKDSGRRSPRGAIVWRSGDGPKPSPAHLTPIEAADALHQLLAAAPRGPRVPDGPRVTFGDATVEWLRYVEDDRQRAYSTLNDYRNTVRRYLLPHFGAETPLEEIDTAAVEAFREQLLAEGRLSRRTVQKILVLLHGVFKRAKRRGWLAANPGAEAERVSVRRSGDFNVLTPVQVSAVVRACEREQDGVAIAVAAYTGLRLGELRALRWRDVDFSKALVHVRRSLTLGQFGPPKSQKVRSVPLIDQAASALDQLSRRERFVGPDDLVFINTVGRAVEGSVFRDSFYAALKTAGLGDLREKPDPIVFHDLRHTFGTLAVQAFPLSDVRAYMGHADIQTTMIYVHHVPRHDAAARLSAVVGEEASGGPATSTTSEAVPAR